MVKLIFLFAVTIFTAVEGIMNKDSSFDNSTTTTVFKAWQSRFQRTFKSPTEEEIAKKNLIRNMREIEIHNIRYKVGRETYSRGLWELSDLTFEEKTSVLAGSIFNFSDHLLQGSKKKFKSVKVPSELNWVKSGRVHSIQNQAKCGSCFAFAAVGTVEGVLLKKGINTKLSIQQIVDCDDLNYGCDGGDPLLAFRYIKSNGLASADNYPYTAHQGRCKQQSDTKLAISSASREILNGNENRLKQFVANYGPVAVAINAAKSFSNYRSGIYTNSKCSKDLNHAMLLVGYGYDSKTKLDYWLVKNSWGTSWGESGYARMARNKGSICGIASEVIYAT